MTINDAGLVVMANAFAAGVTHMQAHSADPGSDGTGFEIGSRVAVGAYDAVDADGDITWTSVPFTGLGASATFWGVSYWSASSSGTCYGTQARSGGDTTANAAGAYTWSGAETGTAS
jgi:hypothetical protein